MAHHSFAAYLFVILSCLSSSTTFLVKCSSNSNDLFQPDFLTVPTPEFLSSLQSTIETVREVTGVVSQFSSVFGDFRVSNAIADCLDLLDFSDDELNLTLSSAQNPNGKKGKTGNPSFDMRTWLSGALVNQDTCLEGFEGSNSYVHTLVSQSLNQITPLLHNILGQIHPMIPSSTVVGRSRKLMRTYEQQFPSWLKSHERKLLQTGGGGVTADVVVAADGTGNYTSINDAISAAPELSAKRFVIYIKKGVYTEYVEIHKKKWNIMMIGDGMDVTVISGNRNFIDGWTTYRSATFGVKGQGFIARDITFQNTAGAEKHQAVAFRSDSDLSVLYRCAFRGYQDTLYAHSLRQFYKECTITGTVDFIFGDGSVVFQNCQIHARKGLPNQKNTITAQGRKDIGEPTGFSIQFSNISVESDVLTSLNSTETYLGRPWKLYSRTVIMQSYISDAIKPRGWLEWNGNFGLDSLYYGEYMNFGPGAGLSGRVNWTGFHAINDQSVANNYTVAQFILGNSWLPSTGVKYTAGLIV